MENPPNDEPMPTPKTMIWTETEACRRQVRISFWLLRLYDIHVILLCTLSCVLVRAQGAITCVCPLCFYETNI